MEVKDRLKGPNSTSRLSRGVKRMFVCVQSFLPLFRSYSSFFHTGLVYFHIQMKAYYCRLLSLLHYLGYNNRHRSGYKEDIKLCLTQGNFDYPTRSTAIYRQGNRL